MQSKVDKLLIEAINTIEAVAVIIIAIGICSPALLMSPQISTWVIISIAAVCFVFATILLIIANYLSIRKDE